MLLVARNHFALAPQIRLFSCCFRITVRLFSFAPDFGNYGAKYKNKIISMVANSTWTTHRTGNLCLHVQAFSDKRIGKSRPRHFHTLPISTNNQPEIDCKDIKTIPHKIRNHLRIWMDNCQCLLRDVFCPSSKR